MIRKVEGGKRMVGVGQRARFGIPEDSNQEMNIKFEKVKDRIEVRDQQKNEENINRLNLGYDEAPFTFVT